MSQSIAQIKMCEEYKFLFTIQLADIKELEAINKKFQSSDYQFTKQSQQKAALANYKQLKTQIQARAYHLSEIDRVLYLTAEGMKEEDQMLTINKKQA